MKFDALIISNVMVTLGPFFKKYICIKVYKDRKVTFCDITILKSQTVLHAIDIENISFDYFKTM